MEIFDFGILENQRDLEDENLLIGEQDLVLFELEQQTSVEIKGIAENISLTSESSLVTVQLKVAEDSNGNNVIDDNDRIIEEQIQFPDRRVLESEEPVSLQDINLSPGDYLLELTAIPGNESTTFGEVEYSIELIPTLEEPPTNNDNVEALEFNQVISGNVETDEQDIYTFNGSTGQRLYYDHLSASLVLREFVNGSVFLPSEVPSNDRGPFTLTETEDGTYSLVFSRQFPSLPGGQYSFQLLDIADAPEITLNNPENGKIDFDAETDLYRFSGLEGQELLIDNLDDISKNATFKLFDPDNELVDDSQGLGDFEVILEKTGEYVLAVEGDNTSGEFDYSFELTTPNDNVMELDFQTPYEDTLESGEQKTFTFVGSIGQRLYFDNLTRPSSLIDIVTPSNDNTNPDGLFIPVGGKLSSDRGLYTITANGTYSLVFGTIPDGRPDGYDFRLLNVADAPEITINNPERDRQIERNAETDLYRFSGLEGQELLIDNLDDVSKNATFRLFDPDNDLVDESQGLGDFEVTLEKTGEYVLAVVGNTPSGEFDYSFVLTTPAENAPPVALDDTASTDEDTALTFTFDELLENDDDPDNDELVIIDTGTAIGSVVLNENAETIDYRPNIGFNFLTDGETATDTFEYTISDGNGNTASASVTITVTGINDNPNAVDDVYDDIPENTPLIINPGEGVLSNDTDPEEDTLAVTLIEDVNNGDLELESDGSFTYTPNDGFTGTDQFTYEVNDGNGGTDTATVELIVNEINSNPIAVDDFYDTPENTPLIINPSEGILSNDTDPEGDLLTITFNENVENGNLELNQQDGSFSYTPNDGFTGTDQFTYEISDGNGGTDTATVILTVEDDPQMPTDIIGTPGRDTLTGTNIDENIIGFQGPDKIITGQGNDTIIYESIIDAGDIIEDLEIGSDIIDLRGMLESVGFNGLDPIDDGYISFMSSGSGTILMLDADGDGSALARPYLFVDNVTETELSNSDNFIFV